MTERNDIELSDYLPYLINRVGSALVARFSAPYTTACPLPARTCGSNSMRMIGWLSPAVVGVRRVRKSPPSK